MKYPISFLLLLFVISSCAQTTTKLPDDVVKSIEKRIEEGINPSIVVGIIDKNGARYFNFGKKSANGTAADEHTIYEIGSISKTFTAILLAQQVKDGKMNLGDPIRNYLPATVTIPKRGDMEITLGNLSDHTSALPRMPGNFAPADNANPYADYTVEQMYAFISSYQLTRDIGSGYEYSNLAQGLLGHILSLKAGVPYEALMIKNIASPLGMNETKITFDEKMKKNLAIGHSGGVEVKNWDLPTLAGAGAIRSSTSDMLKYLAANMGLVKTSLRPAMDLTHTVRHGKAGDVRVGLAWHIIKGKNGDVIMHNGGTGGYRTFAGFVKETGMGVVVLTNSTESADDIGIYLLNPDAKLRVIKPSVASVLRKTIETKGVEGIATEFYELKESKPDQYDFSETALNTLGYSYMETNIKAALAILKLNVDEYPTSFNVYDSYGEALAKDGQKDLAIQNYKKSVELNPGNVGGIAALEKLGVKIEAKAVEVPEAVLQTYVGVYELAPNFKITITRTGKQLFAQATNQPQFEIFASSEKEFYLKVVVAQVIFTGDGQKPAESLTLVQNGQRVPGKRVE